VWNQVLYEDDYLIAVSKPPGIITSPKHRHVVCLTFVCHVSFHFGACRAMEAVVAQATSLDMLLLRACHAGFPLKSHAGQREPLLTQGGSLLNRVISHLGAFLLCALRSCAPSLLS